MAMSPGLPVQPLVSVFALASSARQLAHRHELLTCWHPCACPGLLAAYAVVGERQQATLEPLLTTPISREELLLGKRSRFSSLAGGLLCGIRLFLASPRCSPAGVPPR